MAANDIKEKAVKISGKDFVITTGDRATIALIERENNKSLLKSLIGEVAGEEYNLVFRTPEAKRAISEEDKLTLNRLFNGSVKYGK